MTRILTRVSVTETCWLWTGALFGNGYGQINADSTGLRLALTHRALYEAAVGPIPEGLHLDHLCRVRHCVNPDHLEPVTPAENNRRAAALIVCCPQGHPYDEANTYRHGGHRYCRECHRASDRKRRSRDGR